MTPCFGALLNFNAARSRSVINRSCGVVVSARPCSLSRRAYAVTLIHASHRNARISPQVCNLANRTGSAPSARVGGNAVLGGWVVLGVIPPPSGSSSGTMATTPRAGLVCVVERRWARWGVLLFITPGATTPLASLRTSVGWLPSLEPLQNRSDVRSFAFASFPFG
jgi:hypothetical protein